MKIVNVGTADRVVRVLVGAALLSLVFWYAGPWRWVGLIGIVPLTTGLSGYCGMYRLLGISTCSVEKLPVDSK